MSYQVLARKWRPQNFKQMVGQEHVLKALIHALESQRLHHAYLFTGTRGVGKTTIARILAKCLSCHTGITAEPCGTCGACQSISEGRYIDLIEIDAASRTKVEDMRELLDNVQYAPSEGRFKVYLIDEVHMLSTHSFNALLKTLEEPPEHVKFLFATTDPQKLPLTILSRCLQFNLKNMVPERIADYLKTILTEEQVGFDDAALWALSRAAEGSMRDALSLTDQAIAYGNNTLSEASVSAMLGTVDQKKIYRILDCLVNRDAAVMLDEINALAEYSPDYASVLATLAAILHRVAIEQLVPGATDNAMGDQEQVVSYAQSLCAEDVQLFYQIALVSRKDLAISPDAKAALEMALLRMMAFQLEPPSADTLPLPNLTLSNLPHSKNETEKESELESGTTASTLLTEIEPAALEPVTIEPDQAPDEMPVDESLLSEDDAGLDTKKKTLLTDSSDEPLVASLPEFPPQPESSTTLETKELQNEIDSWPQQAAKLELTGMTRNLVFNMVLEKQDQQLKLYVDKGHFRLLTSSHKTKICKALALEFGKEKMPEFIEGLMPDQETPAMWRERKSAEMREQAKQVMQDDPNVQQLLATFDGVLLENSIQAIGSG